jgi:hypothetical protein
VARAAHDATGRALHLALERLGPDAAGPPLPVTLHCTGLPGVTAVESAGSAPEWTFAPATGRLTVRLALTGRQALTVRW